MAAPESANNAAAQTSFIPLLTLGIPPNAVMALMVGAMTIHGIVPGPQVMTKQPDALTEDFPLILGILADMLRSPTFPAQEVERLRGQFLMSLRESEQETRTQASRVARALLFPPEHPYSRLTSGRIETVKSLTRDDLVAFQQLYHPALTTIAIVGDVEPPAVIEALEQVFGSWEVSSAPPSRPLPPPPPIAGVLRRDIKMAGKVQSDVIWGVHGLSRTDPDYYIASVANMILGRIGLGGRLGDNVREQQGLAYSCGSSLDADVGAGPWAALAGVNPANVERAIEAIVHEIAQVPRRWPDR